MHPARAEGLSEGSGNRVLAHKEQPPLVRLLGLGSGLPAQRHHQHRARLVILTDDLDDRCPRALEGHVPDVEFPTEPWIHAQQPLDRHAVRADVRAFALLGVEEVGRKQEQNRALGGHLDNLPAHSRSIGETPKGQRFAVTMAFHSSKESDVHASSLPTKVQ